jgi:hypothetical protein
VIGRAGPSFGSANAELSVTKEAAKLKVKNDLHSLPSFSTFPEPPFWLAGRLHASPFLT